MRKLLKNINWIYSHCKSCTPYLIIIILIGALSSLLDVSKAMITKYLIDSATSNNIGGIKKWIAILATVLLFYVFLTCANSIISSYCSEKLKNQLQEKLYDHIIHSTWLEHSKYHSVELLTRITNDVKTITDMLVQTIPSMISLFVMLTLSLFALISLSPMMCLISVVIFPFLILLSKIFGKKLNYFYMAIQKNETNYNRFLQESFNNILIVKSFCLEKRKKQELNSIQNNRLKLSLKRSYFNCISSGLLAFSSFLGYFFVFVWGSFNLLSNGISIFGNLTAMLELINNIQYPIFGLSSSFPQLISSLAATDRLIEIQNMPLEHTSYNIDSKYPESINDISKDINFAFNTKISFNNVSFRYIYNKPILNDISFNINSGEILGLVGTSGGGKTTLIRLLLSLIYPNNGDITINDEHLTPSHRKLISYVPQGNTLFSGTILDNLKFGNPTANENDIINALKSSSSFDFINSLSDKLNSVIGEKGIGLSEGQAQRLTIARALLRKKPILILDEATSSLDCETELKILMEIKNLNPKPVCIIITHRLTALSICDRVFKLENKNLIPTAYL